MKPPTAENALLSRSNIRTSGAERRSSCESRSKLSCRLTSPPESLNGNGRNITASITENTAVTPPIPIANVRTAVKANPGALRSWRNAYCKSLAKVCTEGPPRIETVCAEGDKRQPSGHCSTLAKYMISNAERILSVEDLCPRHV